MLSGAIYELVLTKEFHIEKSCVESREPSDSVRYMEIRKWNMITPILTDKPVLTDILLYLYTTSRPHYNPQRHPNNQSKLLHNSHYLLIITTLIKYLNKII